MSKTGKPGEPIREMICISCPLGCRLSLYIDEQEELIVKGNLCPRGREYAQEEYYAPKRIVTATCRVQSEYYPRLPVRTDRALPVELMDELLKRIYELEVTPPIRCGEVLLEGFKGSGVNLIASMSIEGEGNDQEVHSEL